MNTVIKELSGIVSAAFERCGYDGSLGNVIVSNRPDLCHYQCDGSFRGAKLYKKAPLALASEVAERLRGEPAFAEVSAASPGFINLTLSDAWLTDYVNGMMESKNAGIPRAEAGGTVVIDYGGANIAKPLHVGHLRPHIIGEALKRLLRLLGYNVIGDVHLGDWGLQIGLVMAEMSERYPGYSCFGDGYREGDPLPPITADELNELYPFASGRSKSDAAFSEKAHRLTFELQRGKAGFTALWKLIRRTSVDDFRKSYKKLNVDFDLWYGESDADRYVGDVIALLGEKGLLVEDKGARIVEVSEEGDRFQLPPAIIIKSDGAINYQTTDLATLLQRRLDFSPDKIWYVVDKRQELHFTQVFRVAKKAGIVEEKTELAHLWFGTMNGPDGKPFRTRDGGVMRLDEMIENVTEAALAKMRESEYAASGDLREAAEKIGVAAIKFGDMINQMTKDYVFDLDKFLSFEGKTGTYILYTITRANSILRKAGENAGTGGVGGVYSEAERNLMLKIIQTGDAFWAAARDKAMNYVCDSAYQIAAAFSLFYHDNHILSEPDAVKRASWLNLCSFVRSLLTLHMDVLGIETVEFM